MSQLLNFPPTILCFLASMILIMLLINSFFTALPNQSKPAKTWIHELTLIALMISFLWMIAIYPNQKTVLLANHFVWEPLTGLLSLTTLGLSVFVFMYTKNLLVNVSVESDYYILCLLSLLGALVMITAGSPIVFYLGLEILALPLYGLVALNIGTLHIEAAVKYIVMGIVTNVLLLYGLCLLYAVLPQFSLYTLSTTNEQTALLAQVASTLVFTAFLFKLGAVPFHFWVPDVYQASSTFATLFIATISKFAAIAMGLRLFNSSLIQPNTNLNYLLLILGLISTIGGNLVALMQTRLRRLIAYSSIAHMGPILLGLALPIEHHAIVLFYGVNYCFMVATLFGMLIHLDKIGIKADTIEDLNGLSNRYPRGALLLLIITLSMAGIPPSIGFFSKFGLMYHLMNQGFYITAVIYLMGTTIGTYYYLSIIKSIYFSVASSFQPTLNLTHDRSRQLGLFISGVILCSLALFPNVLIEQLEKRIKQPTAITFKHNDR